VSTHPHHKVYGPLENPDDYAVTEMLEGWEAHTTISRQRIVRAWGATKQLAINNLRIKVADEDNHLRRRLALG
jgi:hypothetical protein